MYTYYFNTYDILTYRLLHYIMYSLDGDQGDLEMDIVEHIKELCRQRNWTYYRLAKESRIPHSSLNTLLNKQNVPSMRNLIKICDGFGITLTDFFTGMESPSGEVQELINLWSGFDKKSKELAMAYMCGLAHKGVE